MKKQQTTKPIKQLTLRREHVRELVRELQPHELAQVAGGIRSSGDYCA